jgi:hypothetical protein
MSDPPGPPPSAVSLRPITVAIPDTWTPEQALAVFDLLDDLRDKVWAGRLQTLLQEQQGYGGTAESGTTIDDRSF